MEKQELEMEIETEIETEMETEIVLILRHKYNPAKIM